MLAFILAATVLAEAPCVAATEACTEWVRLPDSAHRVRVYRSFPLGRRNERVRRALVVVHGILRDADAHFRTGVAAALLADASEDTVVVAPRFASRSGGPGNERGGCGDALAPDEANFVCDPQRPDTWRSGGAVVGEATSSFAVVDEVLRTLARKDVFPNLRTIVVAGHSAGGQFVTRYQMVNRVHDGLGVPVEYVVANPSAYAYVDGMRPTAPAFALPSTTGPAAADAGTADTAFAPYADARNCTGFDQWPYGLRGRPAYAAGATEAQLTMQLVARPTTYVLGEQDAVPPLGVFDTSCPAMAQGVSRLARGLAFARYVNEHLRGRHRVVVVPFCGHSQRCVFTSDAVLPVLFPR